MLADDAIWSVGGHSPLAGSYTKEQLGELTEKVIFARLVDGIRVTFKRIVAEGDTVASEHVGREVLPPVAPVVRVAPFCRTRDDDNRQAICFQARLLKVEAFRAAEPQPDGTNLTHGRPPPLGRAGRRLGPWRSR